jgi:Fungal Zn(2)-Cys(6) binuclear cluster domain/Fungal specific transcription factor domain
MPQGRTPRPRTRTFGGCLTCRVRKVKCGQERPTCLNCNRLKVTCRGYQTQLHWVPVNPADDNEQEEELVKNASSGRKNKMRGNFLTGNILSLKCMAMAYNFSLVYEREAMSLKLLQPFLGICLEEGLMEYIDSLERIGANSAAMTAGPFTVFNTNIPKDMEQTPEDKKPLDDAVGSDLTPAADSTDTEAPHEIRFLADHFSSHVTHLLFPMPQAESQWSNIFESKTLKDLVGSGDISHFEPLMRSLLYEILAVSAFHADRLYSTQSTTEDDDRTSIWHACGTRYEKLAWSGIRTYLELRRVIDHGDTFSVEEIIALSIFTAAGVSLSDYAFRVDYA